MRIAVFCCLGLGDGLISLVLSHHLHSHNSNGHVITYHPHLAELQEWFPHLPLRPFPPIEELERELEQIDRMFLFYEKTPRMLSILSLCEQKWPEKLTVLNPIATHRNDYAYWGGGRFNGKKTFVENLVVFCRDQLQIPEISRSNGIQIPQGITFQRYPKRVVIHPTSSREAKNWGWNQYCRLADRLEKNGFEPYFLLTPQERAHYGTFRSPSLNGLPEMASFVAESGAMIGNDSGIGHLASCLGLPTVTICRNARSAHFWRPAWSKGVVLAPPSWVPNLKWLRLRDRYWQSWIHVDQVLDAFHKL